MKSISDMNLAEVTLAILGAAVNIPDGMYARAQYLAKQELRTLLDMPAPVGPFAPDTVVCRRYQLDQAPGQDFYHYDKQTIYGSVPVTLDELIKKAETATVKMPERKEDPGAVAGLSRKWAEGWNDALTEVGRLNGANQCAK